MHIHFIGMSGVGMSGIAEIALHDGHQVSGSDLVRSELVGRLVRKGAAFHLGHDPGNVEGADMVVYTAAVKHSNPELIRAHDMNIAVLSRAEMLGRLMLRYQHSIAVAGSHGKTTTTSMVTSILERAELEPTALVGGDMGGSGGNVRLGGHEYLVTEACEYKEGFLFLKPEIGIVLNVELDHVDCYRDLGSVVHAFKEFSRRLADKGCLVANFDDPKVREIAKCAACDVISYGIQMGGMWSAGGMDMEGPYPVFRVNANGQDLGRWRLKVPGAHNVYNALAASAACSVLGVNPRIIREALEEFQGARRRFEFKGEASGVTIVDDYAHHPTEVAATLKAARRCTKGVLWCVFQPHTFSRTKALLEGFAWSLRTADRVVVSDIYPSRETDRGEVSSKDLVKRLKEDGANAWYGESFEEIAVMISGETKPGDLVLTMGAGDIDALAGILLGTLKQKGLNVS